MIVNWNLIRFSLDHAIDRIIHICLKCHGSVISAADCRSSLMHLLETCVGRVVKGVCHLGCRCQTLLPALLGRSAGQACSKGICIASGIPRITRLVIQILVSFRQDNSRFKLHSGQLVRLHHLRRSYITRFSIFDSHLHRAAHALGLVGDFFGHRDLLTAVH